MVFQITIKRQPQNSKNPEKIIKLDPKQFSAKGKGFSSHWGNQLP
jgi:hypothetical protein